MTRYLQRTHYNVNPSCWYCGEAAASNGLIELVGSYHSHTSDVVKPLLGAAADGHDAVLRVLIESHRAQGASYAFEARKTCIDDGRAEKPHLSC